MFITSSYICICQTGVIELDPIGVKLSKDEFMCEEASQASSQGV